LIRKIDQDLFASYSDDIPTFLKNIYAARGVSEAQLSLGLDSLLRPNFGNLLFGLK
jgi:single-stranded-DNA-specific exonuclease